MTKHRLSIAIPASFASDIPHLRDKTTKIGLIGRAAALFGVKEIIIFADINERHLHRETKLITKVLSYMETPQYLRKQLFGIVPELKYAGVLPPLRTPHHPLTRRVKDLIEGEVREGVVIARCDRGSLVDIGVGKKALIRNKQIKINSRITVRVKKRQGAKIEVKLANRKKLAQYWGYQVTSSPLTFGELLRDRAFDLVISTSKYGKPIKGVLQDLSNQWKSAQAILVAFGAPTRGLYELARQESLDLDEISDFVVNTFPLQEVETVRTEEALNVVLGILRLMVS